MVELLSKLAHKILQHGGDIFSLDFLYGWVSSLFVAGNLLSIFSIVMIDLLLAGEMLLSLLWQCNRSMPNNGESESC